MDTSGGTPQYTIDVGGVSKTAAYVSGSGGTSLVFAYEVQAGDLDDAGGITSDTSALDANSGTLKDADGHDLDLTTIAVSAGANTVGVDAENQAPVFSSGTTANFAENGTGTVYTAVATDADGDTPTYHLIGGSDQALFDVDSSSGALTFKSAPDYETPTDASSPPDNTYQVQIQADDGNGGTATQTVSVTVTDVAENPVQASNISSLKLVGDGVTSDFASGEKLQPMGTSLGDLNSDGSGEFALAGSQPTDAAGSFHLIAGLSDNSTLDDEIDLDAYHPRKVTVENDQGSKRFGVAFSSGEGLTSAGSKDLLVYRGGNFESPNGYGTFDSRAYLFDTQDLLSNSVYSASTPLSATTYADFYNIQGAPLFGLATGDFNGDGTADIHFGSHHHDSGGRSHLVTGDGFYSFGQSYDVLSLVASRGFSTDGVNDLGGGPFAGDFDSDGFDDLIVNGYNHKVTGSLSASVYVVWGNNNFTPGDTYNLYNTADPKWTMIHGSGGQSLIEVSTVQSGDFIGTTTPDLVISARNIDKTYRDLYIIDGDELANRPNEINLSALATNQGVHLTGIHLTDQAPATAGEILQIHTAVLDDLDGDGKNEIGFASSKSNGTDAEVGIVYSQSIAGLSAPFDFSANSNTVTTVDDDVSTTRFGTTIWRAGDVDGDGVQDYGIGFADETAGKEGAHIISGAGLVTPGSSLTVTEPNGRPVFTSGTSFNAAENQLETGYTPAATDPENDSVTFTINGGADADKFELVGGALKFKTAPDFDTPGSADHDNVYEVQIQADDGNGGTATQTVSVTVTDVEETGQSTTTITLGEKDDYSASNGNEASPRTTAFDTVLSGQTIDAYFDNTQTNSSQGFSFDLSSISGPITGATLKLSAKPLNDSGAEDNDTIRLWGSDPSSGADWATYGATGKTVGLGWDAGPNNYFNFDWRYNKAETIGDPSWDITLDLSNFAAQEGTGLSLISDIDQNKILNVLVGDDTIVDYAELDLSLGQSSNTAPTIEAFFDLQLDQTYVLANPATRHTTIPLQDGNFITAWSTSPASGGSGGYYVQKIDGNGQPIGSAKLLDNSGNQIKPSMVELNDGKVALVFTEYHSGRYDTELKILDSDLNIIHQATVDPSTGGDYIEPRLALIDENHFLLSNYYTENHPQIPGSGKYAQVFDFEGSKAGSHFPISAIQPSTGGKSTKVVDGDTVASLWVDFSSGERAYLTFFDLETKASIAEVLISEGGDNGDFGAEEIAVVGNQILVVWVEGSSKQGYMQLFSKNGSASGEKIAFDDGVAALSNNIQVLNSGPYSSAIGLTWSINEAGTWQLFHQVFSSNLEPITEIFTASETSYAQEISSASQTNGPSLVFNRTSSGLEYQTIDHVQQSPYTVTENADVSTVILDVNATDAENDTLQFSVSGTDASLVTIDADDGEVRLNAPADHETKSSYSFTVNVTDGELTDSQDVTVDVVDAFDAIAVLAGNGSYGDQKRVLGQDFDGNGLADLHVSPISGETSNYKFLITDDQIIFDNSVKTVSEISGHQIYGSDSSDRWSRVRENNPDIDGNGQFDLIYWSTQKSEVVGKLHQVADFDQPYAVDLDTTISGNKFKINGFSGLVNLVESVGDLDGDDKDEILVADQSYIYVLEGSAVFSGVGTTRSISEVLNAGLGGTKAAYSVAKHATVAEDFTGDGINEFFIARQNGFVDIISGTAFVTDAETISVAYGGNAMTLSSDVAPISWNSQVVPDLDDDGIPEVAVSIGRVGYTNGHVFVVFGSEIQSNFGQEIDLDTLDGTDGVHLTGHVNSWLGHSFNPIRDVDGDNLPELIVASPEGSSQQYGTGAVYIIYGDAFVGTDGSISLSEIQSTHVGKISGSDTGGMFGHAIDLLSDFSGDGIEEIAIGGNAVDLGMSGGAVYVVPSDIWPNRGETLDMSVFDIV